MGWLHIIYGLVAHYMPLTADAAAVPWQKYGAILVPETSAILWPPEHQKHMQELTFKLL